MFSLANFKLSLVGTNIEKCDRKMVIPIFSLPYLLNNTVETVYIFKKEPPIFKPESSGVIHQKYKIHYLSIRIPVVGPVHHH